MRLSVITNIDFSKWFELKINYLNLLSNTYKKLVFCLHKNYLSWALVTYHSMVISNNLKKKGIYFIKMFYRHFLKLSITMDNWKNVPFFLSSWILILKCVEALVLRAIGKILSIFLNVPLNGYTFSKSWMSWF